MNNTKLSFDVLLDILSRGDSSYCSAERLYSDIGKFNFISIIEEITVTKPISINKDNWKERLKSYVVDSDGLTNFLVSLSKTLSLDERSTIDLWDSYYIEHYFKSNIIKTLPKELDSIKSKLKTDLNSLELLEKVDSIKSKLKTDFNSFDLLEKVHLS